MKVPPAPSARKFPWSFFPGRCFLSVSTFHFSVSETFI